MKVACTNRARACVATAALMFTLSLGGCASSTDRSSLMSAMNEMTTPSKTRPYLPVEDLPQNHQTLLTVDEELKIRSELIAARTRQEAALKAARQQ
jgi:hypothetical protein